MRHLLIITILVLSGCAAEVTSSTSGNIIVKAGFPDLGVEKALVLAEAECAKKGLSARVQAITNPNTDRYIFECV